MKNIVIIIGMLLVAVSLYFLGKPKSEQQVVGRPASVSQANEDGLKEISSESLADSLQKENIEGEAIAVDTGISEVGAVTLSAEQEKEIQKKINDSRELLEKELDYGVNPPVSTVNPQVTSVLTALKNPESYSERLSVAHLPKDFDLTLYNKNPDEYLQVIEPARVFQVAQPGANVQKIERVSEKFPVIQQEEKVELVVKALPDLPVTFTSFDLGRFQNDLTSITVKADKMGLAKASFFGSKGTISKVNILASCPVTSGQVKFVVDIK